MFASKHIKSFSCDLGTELHRGESRARVRTGHGRCIWCTWRSWHEFISPTFCLSDVFCAIGVISMMMINDNTMGLWQRQEIVTNAWKDLRRSVRWPAGKHRHIWSRQAAPPVFSWTLHSRICSATFPCLPAFPVKLFYWERSSFTGSPQFVPEPEHWQHLAH